MIKKVVECNTCGRQETIGDHFQFMGARPVLPEGWFSVRKEGKNWEAHFCKHSCLTQVKDPHASTYSVSVAECNITSEESIEPIAKALVEGRAK